MGLTTLKMPQLGESVTEGTVDRWLKKEGDFVKLDEPLVEVVTDKVNAEVPSPFEGRLTRIQVAEGTTVPIGTALAEMEVEGVGDAKSEGVVEPPSAEAPSAEGPAAPVVAARPATPPPAPGPTLPGEAMKLSPAVRRLAEQNGLDLAQVAGSGAGGRVTRNDVLAFLESRPQAGAAAAPGAPPAPAPEQKPREQLFRLSAVRRQIAEHMVRSKATSPHAWGVREIDLSALVAYREAAREDFARRHGISLTYLPFIIQAVCDALQANPFLNSSWTEEGILVKNYFNIGVAVALPDTLIVPVIRDADRLGLLDLARALADLAQRARTKRLRPEEVRDGTFTVNNTGAIGSILGMAIINQPQAAILSTEKIVKRAVVVDDQIVIRPIMNLSMSFDHRIVDGLQAGRFLDSMQRRLESWTPASIRI